MTARPQRLMVTADLHFGNYASADGCTRQLAEFASGSDADALALAGDVADGPPDLFDACLGLFEQFDGLKLVTPGNHDLWAKGASSLEKYRVLLPRIAADRGFVMLDRKPVTLGRTAFIGNIGWYDYSFRNPALGLSTEQYERKELPGICTWNDGRFIDWPYSDAEFLGRCIGKLKDHYEAVQGAADTVVAVLHHLPFRELLYGPADTSHEFCRAYMGSERLGVLLLGLPLVRYVFCGHRHGPDRVRREHLDAFVVGGEYEIKRLLEFDLSTGEHRTHLFEPSEQEVSSRK